MLVLKVDKIMKDVGRHDWFKKNDLFLVCKYGNQTRRTTTKWNNNDPTWDEVFLFESDHNELEVSLYDEDKFGKNELILNETISVTNHHNSNGVFQETMVCNIRCYYRYMRENLEIEFEDLNEQLDDSEEIMTEIRDENRDLNEQLMLSKEVSDSLTEKNKQLALDTSYYEASYKNLLKKVKSFLYSVTEKEFQEYIEKKSEEEAKEDVENNISDSD